MSIQIINECEYCGYKTREKASKCPLCGAALKQVKQVITDVYENTINTQSNTNTTYTENTTHSNTQRNTSRTTYYRPKVGKNKLVAALFAFFGGSIGLHKFYMGHISSGVLYIMFWWTSIPSILSLIDGIRILCMSDAEFNAIVRR